MLYYNLITCEIPSTFSSARLLLFIVGLIYLFCLIACYDFFLFNILLNAKFVVYFISLPYFLNSYSILQLRSFTHFILMYQFSKLMEIVAMKFLIKCLRFSN